MIGPAAQVRIPPRAMHSPAVVCATPSTRNETPRRISAGHRGRFEPGAWGVRSAPHALGETEAEWTAPQDKCGSLSMDELPHAASGVPRAWVRRPAGQVPNPET